MTNLSLLDELFLSSCVWLSISSVKIKTKIIWHRLWPLPWICRSSYRSIGPKFLEVTDLLILIVCSVLRHATMVSNTLFIKQVLVVFYSKFIRNKLHISQVVERSCPHTNMESIKCQLWLLSHRQFNSNPHRKIFNFYSQNAMIIISNPNLQSN